MLIAFRVDASPAVGGGHVMRCLTLAQELRARGCDVAFLSRAGSTRVAPALARSGLPLAEVGHDPHDVSAALKALGYGRADVAVVDSYALDRDYETALRAAAPRLVAIDDYNTRPHDCDLLLDHTYGRVAGDFAGMLPAGAVVLAGAQYALLRPEFRGLRDAALARRTAGTPVRRILVSLGLTDVGAITRPIARVLADTIPECRIDMVVGAKLKEDIDLDAAGGDSPIRLHVDPPSMAALMAEADLAVGAGGTTTWERCCLGLPTVVVVVAENQRTIARNLADAEAIVAVDGTETAQITEACRQLAQDPARRRHIATQAATICDGSGAARVADAILGLVRRP